MRNFNKGQVTSMYFRFSVDDNIWFLRDLTENNYSSIFEHPYLNVYKDIHDRYNAKFQLNIYYETDGFDLSQMTDRYKNEWITNSDWLRLSFHAKADAPCVPYIDSSYEQAFDDCTKVHQEIIRFAGKETLDLFTTIHFCQASAEALKGFKDAGIRGLVGLFSDGRSCYNITYETFTEPFKYDEENGIYYFTNDMIANLFSLDSIVPTLENVKDKEFIEVMIHEQYFYEYFHMYQPDFKDKVELCIKYLTDQGRTSVFLDDLIEG